MATLVEREDVKVLREMEAGEVPRVSRLVPAMQKEDSRSVRLTPL
jgi:hypothetical protein